MRVDLVGRTVCGLARGPAENEFPDVRLGTEKVDAASSAEAEALQVAEEAKELQVQAQLADATTTKSELLGKMERTQSFAARSVAHQGPNHGIHARCCAYPGYLARPPSSQTSVE